MNYSDKTAHFLGNTVYVFWVILFSLFEVQRVYLALPKGFVYGRARVHRLISVNNDSAVCDRYPWRPLSRAAKGLTP